MATALAALVALGAPAGAAAQEPAADPTLALVLDAAETRLRELDGIAAGQAARLGIRPPVQAAPETLQALAWRVAEMEEVVAFLAARHEELRPRPRPGAPRPGPVRALRRGGPDAVAALAERLGLDPPPAPAPAAAPEEQAVEDARLAAVATWLAGSDEVLRDAELPLLWPTRGRVSSRFGPRWGRMHEGLDIAGRPGTPVVAAAGGTVAIAGGRAGYGRIVVIRHGGGLTTAYAHLASIAVERGQNLGRGDVVGRMGTSGSSTGVHLHFEVRVRGAAVDPRDHVRPVPPGDRPPAPPEKLGPEEAPTPAPPVPGAPAPDCPIPGDPAAKGGRAYGIPAAGFTCEPAAGDHST